jgi:hypothetical protein
MTGWLFSWKAVALGAVILLAAVAVAVAFREGPLGNVASIVGLAVSVLGFVVTIWTIRDARQQIQEAAERAVAQGREETCRVMERIAAHLFAADCAALRSGIEDLRQAALDRQWARAIFR